MDEIEIGGWRTWIHGRSLLMVIGGIVTLAAWRLLSPGWTQVTAVLYVGASIAYAVRDGWPLSRAIPTTAAVATFFIATYLTDWKADARRLLHDQTTVSTVTLIAVIVWAVLATALLLNEMQLRKQDGNKTG